MGAGSERPIPYRLTPAGERVRVMAELVEQVAEVPRTRLLSMGRHGSVALLVAAVITVAAAEGAVSTPCAHEKTSNGPVMPLRHGSAKTAVCDACGAYKLVTWLDKDRSGWRATDVREDVKRAQEGSVDL